MPAGGVGPGRGQLLINQPDIPEALFRALGMKGDLPQQVLQQYQLGVTAADITQPEYMILRRMTSWAQSLTLAAGGAGNFGQWALNVPPSQQGSRSNMAICDKIRIGNNNAAQVFFDIGLSSSANVNVTLAGRARDDRHFTQVSAYQINAVNNVATSPFPSGSARVMVPANSDVEVIGPWILTATTVSLYVCMVTANAPSEVTYFWRERQLLSSELT